MTDSSDQHQSALRLHNEANSLIREMAKDSNSPAKTIEAADTTAMGIIAALSVTGRTKA